MIHHHDHNEKLKQSDNDEREAVASPSPSPSIPSINQFLNSLILGAGGGITSTTTASTSRQLYDDNNTNTDRRVRVSEELEQHPPRYTTGPNAQIGPTYIIRSTGSGSHQTYAIPQISQISNTANGSQYIVQRSSSSSNNNSDNNSNTYINTSRIEELD